MKITLHFFVDLWPILWLITLLRIFLRMSISHTFFHYMATCHENHTSHFCRPMANIMLDNVTKDFSTHVDFSCFCFWLHGHMTWKSLFTFVNLWPILWLIMLLRLFLHISFLPTFFQTFCDRMVTWHKNHNSHSCLPMAVIMVHNVTNDFSTHRDFIYFFGSHGHMPCKWHFTFLSIYGWTCGFM